MGKSSEGKILRSDKSEGKFVDSLSARMFRTVILILLSSGNICYNE